ncbi:GNAT family N-acetyltransferase [Aliikangiella maris]|uniref:GNAT family N-acetyltransferase n=2 Tax=Aliikangiella maris TaxID=3162458 RepID=A0ABV3MR67_9GAMM
MKIFNEQFVFNISDNPQLLDRKMIFDYLSKHSYWSKGISKEVVERSLDHSLTIGAYVENRQVGFCRVISDYATFANLVDVFVVKPFRRQGVATKMMQFILAHEKLQGLRRFMLATRDAHAFYRQFGFEDIKESTSLMQRYNSAIYQKNPH